MGEKVIEPTLNLPSIAISNSLPHWWELEGAPLL